MPRKQRIDTAKGAVNTMQNANVVICPPEHVIINRNAMPFWHSIVDAKAADKWTQPDLEMAANLARTKADIERLQKELLLEGDIVKNDRGTQIVNPKHNLLETLSRRAIALSKALQIDCTATQGRPEKQAPANKAASKAKKTLANLDESLVARPN